MKSWRSVILLSALYCSIESTFLCPSSKTAMEITDGYILECQDAICRGFCYALGKDCSIIEMPNSEEGEKKTKKAIHIQTNISIPSIVPAYRIAFSSSTEYCEEGIPQPISEEILINAEQFRMRLALHQQNNYTPCLVPFESPINTKLQFLLRSNRIYEYLESVEESTYPLFCISKCAQYHKECIIEMQSNKCTVWKIQSPNSFSTEKNDLTLQVQEYNSPTVSLSYFFFLNPEKVSHCTIVSLFETFTPPFSTTTFPSLLRLSPSISKLTKWLSLSRFTLGKEPRFSLSQEGREHAMHSSQTEKNTFLDFVQLTTPLKIPFAPTCIVPERKKILFPLPHESGRHFLSVDTTEKSSFITRIFDDVRKCVKFCFSAEEYHCSFVLSPSTDSSLTSSLTPCTAILFERKDFFDLMGAESSERLFRHQTIYSVQKETCYFSPFTEMELSLSMDKTISNYSALISHLKFYSFSPSSKISTTIQSIMKEPFFLPYESQMELLSNRVISTRLSSTLLSLSSPTPVRHRSSSSKYSLVETTPPTTIFLGDKRLIVAAITCNYANPLLCFSLLKELNVDCFLSLHYKHVRIYSLLSSLEQPKEELIKGLTQEKPYHTLPSEQSLLYFVPASSREREKILSQKGEKNIQEKQLQYSPSLSIPTAHSIFPTTSNLSFSENRPNTSPVKDLSHGHRTLSSDLSRFAPSLSLVREDSIPDSEHSQDPASQPEENTSDSITAHPKERRGKREKTVTFSSIQEIVNSVSAIEEDEGEEESCFSEAELEIASSHLSLPLLLLQFLQDSKWRWNILQSRKADPLYSSEIAKKGLHLSNIVLSFEESKEVIRVLDDLGKKYSPGSPVVSPQSQANLLNPSPYSFSRSFLTSQRAQKIASLSSTRLSQTPEGKTRLQKIHQKRDSHYQKTQEKRLSNASEKKEEAKPSDATVDTVKKDLQRFYDSMESFLQSKGLNMKDLSGSEQQLLQLVQLPSAYPHFKDIEGLNSVKNTMRHFANTIAEAVEEESKSKENKSSENETNENGEEAKEMEEAKQDKEKEQDDNDHYYFYKLIEPKRSILLYGPPGNGKSMIAKAAANEVKATFFFVSPSSLTSKWFGGSASLVKTLFTLAEKLQPSIVFIDELDSLMSSRDSHNGAMNSLKSEMLINLNKILLSKQIFIIGATNLPSILDDAFRRRFSHQLFIGLPTKEQRRQYLEGVFSKKGDETNISVKKEEMEKIAEKLKNFSYYDIFNVAKDAALQVVRENRDRLTDIKERSEFPPVLVKHLLAALKKFSPSLSATLAENLVKYGHLCTLMDDGHVDDRSRKVDPESSHCYYRNPNLVKDDFV